MATNGLYRTGAVCGRGFIVLGLALIFGGLSRGQQQRVHRSMFVLWVLMALALSPLHCI